VETGSPILPALTETSAGINIRVRGDQMDHAWFPRNGHRLVASAYIADKSFGSDNKYQRVEGLFDAVRSWGAHTVSARLVAGSDLNSNMPVYENFTLGGPMTLSGYHIGEFSGKQMAFGRLGYYNRALPLPDILGSGLYIGGTLEAGRLKDRIDGTGNTGTLKSASMFLGADTFLGPSYLGVGIAPGNRWTVYLLLGAP
jgi:NTE family protein